MASEHANKATLPAEMLRLPFLCSNAKRQLQRAKKAPFMAGTQTCLQCEGHYTMLADPAFLHLDPKQTSEGTFSTLQATVVLCCCPFSADTYATWMATSTEKTCPVKYCGRKLTRLHGLRMVNLHRVPLTFLLLLLLSPPGHWRDGWLTLPCWRYLLLLRARCLRNP